MSILIKGMEMPKNEELVIICSDGTVEKTNNDGSRICEQKAIELPPHGDLIDKRMLINDISNNAFANADVNCKEEYDFWNRVWEYIRKIPVVLESEE